MKTKGFFIIIITFRLSQLLQLGISNFECFLTANQHVIRTETDNVNKMEFKSLLACNFSGGIFTSNFKGTTTDVFF